MTAQFSDTVVFDDRGYELIGESGGPLIDFNELNMEPFGWTTACQRGFICTYHLKDLTLYLTRLILCEKNAKYLYIGKVKPEHNKYTALYEGLDRKVNFTGKLRLARGFMENFYVHMGYQNAIAYRTVLDITLKDSQVITIKNRSLDMVKKRWDLYEHHNGAASRLPDKISKAFSLDMKLK